MLWRGTSGYEHAGSCGTSQTANQAESESTEENLVLMEETLPQTAADETVMAFAFRMGSGLLPSVEGVDAEYSEPIPDYLRIGEKLRSS